MGTLRVDPRNGEPSGIKATVLDPPRPLRVVNGLPQEDGYGWILLYPPDGRFLADGYGVEIDDSTTTGGLRAAVFSRSALVY